MGTTPEEPKEPCTSPCGAEWGSELLLAAERALFDATARLQEAVSVIDRERASPPAATLARARQWAALIEEGLARLTRGRRVCGAPPRPPL